MCCTGRCAPSQCETITGPSFSSLNKPDQERTPAYRDSSGSESPSGCLLCYFFRRLGGAIWGIPDKVHAANSAVAAIRPRPKAPNVMRLTCASPGDVRSRSISFVAQCGQSKARNRPHRLAAWPAVAPSIQILVQQVSRLACAVVVCIRRKAEILEFAGRRAPILGAHVAPELARGEPPDSAYLADSTQAVSAGNKDPDLARPAARRAPLTLPPSRDAPSRGGGGRTARLPHYGA